MKDSSTYIQGVCLTARTKTRRHGITIDRIVCGRVVESNRRTVLLQDSTLPWNFWRVPLANVLGPSDPEWAQS